MLAAVNPTHDEGQGARTGASGPFATCEPVAPLFFDAFFPALFYFVQFTGGDVAVWIQAYANDNVRAFLPERRGPSKGTFRYVEANFLRAMTGTRVEVLDLGYDPIVTAHLLFNGDEPIAALGTRRHAKQVRAGVVIAII